ncbi:hypothetical protein NQ318_005326 [Aromia moschata]|uniref:Uncharacterized protein n=1 Tax=Aromia moschata TaxID=1265417 RepID=A0AAV8XUE4_9CUCU|nr:hypothetical protein NQ318_005326 [Aromia moschata]
MNLIKFTHGLPRYRVAVIGITALLDTTSLLREAIRSQIVVMSRGRETAEDDLRLGRPSTSKTDENIEKIGKLIREDRRLSIRELAETTGIDKEFIRQILHESFNMRKVGAKIVPKLLTPEQKESRMNIYADILHNIDTDPGLLDTMTLKGRRFESVEAVKAKATKVLNQLTEADFQHCFQQWKSRMERCRDRQGGVH